MSKMVPFSLFFRDLYIGNGLFSGSLYGDWIFRAQNRSRAASRPGHCRRISKSSSFAPTTVRQMPILLQAEISKKSGICPCNRMPDADPVTGANTGLFRPPPPGTPRTLPMMMMIKIKIKIKDKSKNKNKNKNINK